VFYTYAHYTPEGKLFYIGKGTGGRYKTTLKRSKRWRSFVQTHGKPKMEILADWKTEQEALDHERFLIACFRDMGYELCNLADGGKGSAGYKLPTEAKAKISASLIGNTYSIGHEQTVAHRTKNSVKQLDNSRAKGNKHSDQYKERISDLLLGNTNAVKNQYKWIGVHQVSGNVISFYSSNDLNKAGFQHANVIKCLNGERKSHKGYTWRRELWENK
jgi:hypothetical protein